ncbi:MAG: glycosyltransferase family 1 protein [Patescibacteria group bacterium]|nr:glycosyltransferase family 4 protein [Patescibacteria group bacterium]
MNEKKLKVWLDTKVLTGGHALRGIGVYTSLLQQALSKHELIELVDTPGKANIIHYPYFDFFFSTLPFSFFKKTVVTIHDTIPLIFPDHYQPGFKGQLRFIRQKQALKTVRAVMTDSNSSAFDIKTFLSISNKKIHVVPLAANPNLFSQTSDMLKKIRRKYQLPKLYALYVGDINFNKNLPNLIKMLKYLPKPVKLVCVGKNFEPQPIPEWQWLETQLTLSDVASRVKFMTNLKSDDLVDLSGIYQQAVCYVQPSFYEGFGLPVLEAMQVGTPVVASKTSSLPEVVGEAGLLVEPDAEALASGVSQILDYSPTKRQTVIKLAKQHAGLFNWQKVADQTVKVYLSL